MIGGVPLQAGHEALHDIDALGRHAKVDMRVGIGLAVGHAGNVDLELKALEKSGGYMLDRGCGREVLLVVKLFVGLTHPHLVHADVEASDEVRNGF
jgi:hypothetical protein